MVRTRRVRNGVRSPTDRASRRELDAGPDSARRRRARARNPGPRGAVWAIFAPTDRYQPLGLERRDGAARGLRGLRAVRPQAAGERVTDYVKKNYVKEGVVTGTTGQTTQSIESPF